MYWRTNCVLLNGKSDSVFIVTGHHDSNFPCILFAVFQIFDATQTLGQGAVIHLGGGLKTGVGGIRVAQRCCSSPLLQTVLLPLQ